MIGSLEHPLMNGAGCVKDFDGVMRMARSAVSAVALGSITHEHRMGNSGDVFSVGGKGAYSLNAFGLPNPGIHAIAAHDLPACVRVCHEWDKPLIVSIAGFDWGEWIALARACKDAGVDAIELNFGCPNVQNQHPIWSFDPAGMNRVMLDVIAATGGRLFVGAKFSPFSNPGDLARAAAAVPKSLAWVTTSNTFPNAGKRVLTPEFGGLGGPALKPIALGQIRQLKKALPSSVKLIGAGGVRSYRDIEDYLDVGAQAVQAVTAYYEANEDPMVFSDILAG